MWFLLKRIWRFIDIRSPLCVLLLEVYLLTSNITTDIKKSYQRLVWVCMANQASSSVATSKFCFVLPRSMKRTNKLETLRTRSDFWNRLRIINLYNWISQSSNWIVLRISKLMTFFFRNTFQNWKIVRTSKLMTFLQS